MCASVKEEEEPKAKGDRQKAVSFALRSQVQTEPGQARLGSTRLPLKVFTFYLRNYTWANRICVRTILPNGSPSGCVNFLALSTRNQTQHPAQKAQAVRQPGRHFRDAVAAAA